MEIEQLKRDGIASDEMIKLMNVLLKEGYKPIEMKVTTSPRVFDAPDEHNKQVEVCMSVNLIRYAAVA